MAFTAIDYSCWYFNAFVKILNVNVSTIKTSFTREPTFVQNFLTWIQAIHSTQKPAICQLNERTNKPTNSDLNVQIKLPLLSLLVSFNFLANFTSKSTVLRSIFKFVPENLPGFVDLSKIIYFLFSSRFIRWIPYVNEVWDLYSVRFFCIWLTQFI